MHIVTFLSRLVEHHETLVYALIYLGVVAEGEFVLLCVGTLLYLGGIDLAPTLLFVLAGGLTKTLLGYHIGKWIGVRWSKTNFLKYIERHGKKVVPHFERRPFWSIFISKFFLVNHVVILYAGYKKVSYVKYLRAEIASTLLWVPALLFIGYSFSFAAIRFSHEVSEFIYIVLALIALFLVLDKMVSWAYKVFEEFHETIQ